MQAIHVAGECFTDPTIARGKRFARLGPRRIPSKPLGEGRVRGVASLSMKACSASRVRRNSDSIVKRIELRVSFVSSIRGHPARFRTRSSGFGQTIGHASTRYAQTQSSTAPIRRQRRKRRDVIATVCPGCPSPTRPCASPPVFGTHPQGCSKSNPSNAQADPSTYRLRYQKYGSPSDYDGPFHSAGQRSADAVLMLPSVVALSASPTRGRSGVGG